VESVSVSVNVSVSVHVSVSGGELCSEQLYGFHLLTDVIRVEKEGNIGWRLTF
jgi:hypothetical protein